MCVGSRGKRRLRPMRAWRFWIVFVLGLVAAAAAVRSLQPREPASARHARRAFAAGRFAEADRALEDWLRRAPRTGEAHCLKARTALALSAPQAQVETAYRRAAELGCPESKLAVLRAIGQAKTKRYAEAEPVLRDAFNAGSVPDPQLYRELARLYLETFDMGRAKMVLDRWSRAVPDDPTPHLWRVEVDRRNSVPAAVIIQDYREALARAPDLAAARLGLADALREQHRNAEAGAAYDAYLRLRPDDPSAHLGAGRNARELGDDVAAARHFDAALALDPRSAEAHRARADLDRRGGDDRAALAHLDEAVAIDPFDIDTRHARSLLLARLGRKQDAQREQAAAQRLRDDLRQLGTLKATLLKGPNNSEVEAQIARWMFDHGHPNEGARWAEKIVRDQPSHPLANRLLADYHERRGSPGRANFYRLNAGPKP